MTRWAMTRWDVLVGYWIESEDMAVSYLTYCTPVGGGCLMRSSWSLPPPATGTRQQPAWLAARRLCCVTPLAARPVLVVGRRGQSRVISVP